jgi:hypothetical protein
LDNNNKHAKIANTKERNVGGKLPNVKGINVVHGYFKCPKSVTHPLAFIVKHRVVGYNLQKHHLYK